MNCSVSAPLEASNTTSISAASPAAIVNVEPPYCRSVYTPSLPPSMVAERLQIYRSAPSGVVSTSCLARTLTRRVSASLPLFLTEARTALFSPTTGAIPKLTL